MSLMPSVLVLLAEGFEEIEAITPIDLLRRAGAEVTFASLAPTSFVRGRSGVALAVETELASVAGNTFDCVLLPGGPGVRHLRSDPRVLALVRQQHERDGWLAAICAAPTVLLDAGVLQGRRHTAHHSVRAELPGLLGHVPVVRDGRILTSRGAGTALPFSLQLIGFLFSPEKAAEIAESIDA